MISKLFILFHVEFIIFPFWFIFCVDHRQIVYIFLSRPALISFLKHARVFMFGDWDWRYEYVVYDYSYYLIFYDRKILIKAIIAVEKTAWTFSERRKYVVDYIGIISIVTLL